MLPHTLYHIYNRGNNRDRIFYKRANYHYFLGKVRKYFLPYVDILAYCLMPNHFHFLVYSKEDLVTEKWSNDLRIMLSSYTRAINKQEGRVGSLFQQNTKVKLLENTSRATTLSGGTTCVDYPWTCFHYIHQNPLKAGLVRRMEDYEFSSFRDYAGLRDSDLCKKALASDLIGISDTPETFATESYAAQIIT